MTDTPLPLPEGLRWIKLVCRLGRLAHDGADTDDKPDLLPTAGKVRLASSPARLRVQEADGRWRSVSLDDREYTIRADGELVDTEGRVGVWIPDPASELLDPRPYTLVATVTPGAGERWAAKITGETLPDVVDLVAHSETVAIPASAVPGLSSRIASLEGILADGGGGVDVGQAVEDYLDAAVPPAVDAAVAPHIEQVQQISGLTGEDEAVALLVRTPDSSVRTAIEETFVASPTVGRIIAVAEDQPTPPLLDGDILVRYAIPGASYYTDFSGDTVGAMPAGWSVFGAAAPWQVVADAEAEGGKSLQLTGVTAIGRRGIAWDAPSADTAAADVEILTRWRCSIAGRGSLSAGRATPDWDTSGDVLMGGLLENGLLRAHAVKAGTYSSTNGVESQSVVGQWYMTRYRIDGDTTMVRQWADGDPEPLVWQVIGTTAGVTAAGLVGLASMRVGGERIDWVAVATGGRKAVKP